MKNKVIIYALVVALLAAMAASALAEYPLTLTDQGGRTVTIEQAPERLVSGYYISTSLLIALGKENDLVGIEAKAGSRPIYRMSAPALLDLPSVGTAKQFDLEGCAALAPDLVILPMKLKDAAQTLSELGIPALLVNPEDQALLTEMIELLGSAVGAESAAEALRAYQQQVIEQLSTALAETERPTVYLAGNSSMLNTAGGAMYQSSLIDLAGGANVAIDLPDTYWSVIDYEQLLAWDPEYIILASDAAYTLEDVLADEALAGCRAVLDGKVYQLPGSIESWDSPVPSGVLGAVWLASVLHPDVVTAEDFASAVKEFYGTFYHFDAALPQE